MENNKLIIKQAKIIDSSSPYNGQVKDLLIENDEIKAIEDSIQDDNAEVFEASNLHISPGWFDLRANFNDPGHEEKEDIESGINAAIYGGFTSVAVSPQTEPVLDSKADIGYIYKKSEGFPVNIYPYGAFTKGLKGKEIGDMYDMYEAGAVGFSHGKRAVNSSSIMKLALQYSREFAPPLHVFSCEETLQSNGQMHEGESSIMLGLKGIPSLAEEVQVLRDLHLADYSESSIHFTSISSKSVVDILKSAQQEGKEFTADVSVANLFFTDEELNQYDTNLKTLPPLRAKEDREALIFALREGIIQAIASDHSPQETEGKKCEFDYAEFGMIALESFFGATLTALEGKIELSKIIDLISINPRKILNLSIPSIKEGNWAELTLFDPDKEWSFSKEDIQSKSSNTPFIGKILKGKALGIVNNGILVWMD
jgi:dihydroorotase